MEEWPQSWVIWKYNSHTLFSKRVKTSVVCERHKDEGIRREIAILTHNFSWTKSGICSWTKIWVHDLLSSSGHIALRFIGRGYSIRGSLWVTLCYLQGLLFSFLTRHTQAVIAKGSFGSLWPRFSICRLDCAASWHWLKDSHWLRSSRGHLYISFHNVHDFRSTTWLLPLIYSGTSCSEKFLIDGDSAKGQFATNRNKSSLCVLQMTRAIYEIVLFFFFKFDAFPKKKKEKIRGFI